MSNRKSNQDICDFYKDKSEYTLTLKYFENWYKSNKDNNEYLVVYDDFCKKNFLVKIMRAFIE